jgi:hypothetical protein
MKHLVIGAGATYAEACALGVEPERRTPLMSNFARKTWSNYTPYPLLWAYLREELGLTDLGTDPRELFFELEEQCKTNIEKFLEYAWVNRDRTIVLPEHERLESGYIPPGYISGLGLHQHVPGHPIPESKPDYWSNFLYHGVGMPLSESIMFSFFVNGSGFADLKLSKQAASWLEPGDLVLSLNYDTIFEMALDQAKRPFVYAPELANAKQIKVCKPHGSLNLMVGEAGDFFTFGQADYLGAVQPPGMRSFMGLVPPTLNKQYARHPIAQRMVKSVKRRHPQEMTFWGLGFTESDADLFDLFRLWARSVKYIDVINPDRGVAPRIGAALARPYCQYDSLDAWLAERLTGYSSRR